MENIRIVKAEKTDKFILDAVLKLLSQLTSGNIIFTESDLDSIVMSESTSLYLMYAGAEVIGMFTLVKCIVPSGVKYWLEDVVVDSEYRGKSLGRKLIDEAVRIVSGYGKSTLMLTSKPSRVAANRLYRSSGFIQKETNVYKMDFE